jgi:hypothetical protein
VGQVHLVEGPRSLLVPRLRNDDFEAPWLGLAGDAGLGHGGIGQGTAMTVTDLDLFLARYVMSEAGRR